MSAYDERDELVQQLFKEYDEEQVGYLNNAQLQAIHCDMRLGGISLPQVKAAMEYVCAGDGCDQQELFDVLQEMDRRYFLLQDFRWEFSMLDYSQTDTISIDNAKWLLESVHGQFFSASRWDQFVRRRAVPGSGVSFPELEVMLCNVPSVSDMLDEEEEERRLKEEHARKEHELQRRIAEEKDRIRKQREKERTRRKQEDAQRKAEEDKRRQEEEAERLEIQKEKDEEDRRRQKLLEDEERGKREADERERKLLEEKENAERQKQLELQELQRLKEMEAQAAKEEAERRAHEATEAMADEEILVQAIIDIKDSNQKMEEARKDAAKANDARTKKEYEDEEKSQRLRNKEAKNKRVKYQLKVAYKNRDKAKLSKAVKDFKDANLPDDDKDLEKAEKLLMEWGAGDGLSNAMDKRDLKELENAMNFVRRNGFEPQLAKRMIEANKLLLQLKRLERIRAEIMELKQSTVAEIRSYSKPPVIVHTVMIATFLLHGHPEKQTKDWQTVQALVGKTGKEGLKRRCLGMEPNNLSAAVAGRAKMLLDTMSLEEVRDVSAGAATFYLWSSTMIEECQAKHASDATKKNAKQGSATAK